MPGYSKIRMKRFSAREPPGISSQLLYSPAVLTQPRCDETVLVRCLLDDHVACAHHYRISRRALTAAQAAICELPGIPRDAAAWIDFDPLSSLTLAS